MLRTNSRLLDFQVGSIDHVSAQIDRLAGSIGGNRKPGRNAQDSVGGLIGLDGVIEVGPVSIGVRFRPMAVDRWLITSVLMTVPDGRAGCPDICRTTLVANGLDVQSFKADMSDLLARQYQKPSARPVERSVKCAIEKLAEECARKGIDVGLWMINPDGQGLRGRFMDVSVNEALIIQTILSAGEISDLEVKSIRSFITNRRATEESDAG